jgi:hypothetical protein
MPSRIGLIVGVGVAAVVFWLLSFVVPSFIAALVALVVFLAMTFGGVGFGTRADARY